MEIGVPACRVTTRVSWVVLVKRKWPKSVQSTFYEHTEPAVLLIY